MYADKKIVATIETRMTSSRLPGKVLLPLGGKPALERLVERIRRSVFVDEIVVATTVNPEDEPIIELCERIGCTYFRGSEDDVLSRVLDAAESVSADIIVEITGDCPLIDHQHIDEVIQLFFSGNYDYASNVISRSFPDGFDVQVFPLKVLQEVDKLTTDPVDRVHVSYYIYSHPEKFNLANWQAEGEMFWPELRVTLDERADYELLNRIYEELLPVREDFSAEDVITLLKKNSELTMINSDVRTKEVQEG
jgi:spore coat polysaccharide biosynthesis protein SpsF